MNKSIILFIIFIITHFLCSIVVASVDNKAIKFITIADIHFNPFASCVHTIPCPLIEKLRYQPALKWGEILYQYDAIQPRYQQDTTYSLLSSTLITAKKIADDNQVQFVLVLGDLIGHTFRKNYKKYSTDTTRHGYQVFVKKTFEYLNNEFEKTFSHSDVYMLLGNNDSYQGNYVTNSKGDLFKDLSGMWSQLIKNKSNQLIMQKEFNHAGYYAVTIPNQSHLRLIVLNTNVFSYKARGHEIDKIATDELMWLHNELQFAKDNNQKVIIAMHIPKNIEFYLTSRIRLFILMTLWKLHYIQRFQDELQQFSPEIVSIFTGHLHADWFHIEKFNQSDEISMIGIPSISPIYGNNPEFNVFLYSPQLSTIENSDNYYYSINGKKAWSKIYFHLFMS